MLWYCAWRVLTGQHRSISLHFPVAGHTKCAPDWCFGLLKRSHEVSSLTDLETVVNNSAGVNQALLVGREDGVKLVTVHDWQAHLGKNVKALLGMKQFHHFHADSSRVCCFNRTADDEEWIHV